MNGYTIKVVSSHVSDKGNHVIVIDVFVGKFPAGKMWTFCSNEEDVPEPGTVAENVSLARDDQGFWKFA